MTQTARAAPEGAGLLQSLRLVLHELPALVSDRVHLFTLELQRAGQALAQIVALVTAAAILACTAWVALWVGVALALAEAGLGWGWGIVAIIALNLGAAWLALVRARSLGQWLALPATVRRLTAQRRPADAPAQAGAAAEPQPAPAVTRRSDVPPGRSPGLSPEARPDSNPAGVTADAQHDPSRSAAAASRL